jgi:molecular chaperone DnaK
VDAEEIVVGVDLGTSFSTAAAFVRGKLYLVPGRGGEPCIPSVVHFPGGGRPPRVGAEAERYRMAEPDASVSGVKRILGRQADAPEVSLFEAQSAVRVAKAPNGQVILRTRHDEVTPQEVASRVFRHLKERAETRFSATIRKAVITVPATAEPPVVEATVSAARSAGLEVLRTLTEPAAASIAYHLDDQTGHQRLLVYDFGGGTFDCTLLEQSKDGFRTAAAGGDPCLGGDDLDLALAHQVASFLFRSRKVDVTKDVVRWERLVRTSEQTKRALSIQDTAPFRLPDAYSADRRTQDLLLNVHRDDVEPKWQPLINRSLKATAEMLMKASLRPDHVDATVLVGGTCYVPMVRRMVQRLMGQPGVVASNPQTAVAVGAAVVASRSVRHAA